MSRTSLHYGWNRFFGTLSAVQIGLKNLVDLIDAKFYARGYVDVAFTIPAAELSAGTTIEMFAPFAGKVKSMRTIIQTNIVTGGVITAKVGTTDIAGLSITIPDGATKGTVQADSTASATAAVSFGDRIQIVPSAAFNGGGAVSGFLRIQLD